jgi:hypothetical protein
MTILLKEKINENHLLEVLKCKNLPNDTKGFEIECEKEWFEHFKKGLYLYYKLPKEGAYRKIKYDPGKYSRRLFCHYGLQRFQRDVRKYLCLDDQGNPMYHDLDIYNCFPTILQQLYIKYEVKEREFLKIYNANRDETIKKYKLKDKLTLIKIIQNEKSKHKEPIINDFIKSIFNELFSKLFNDHAYYYTENEKNAKGKFMARVLQYYERLILNASYEFLSQKGYKINVLVFDGLMIEKSKDYKVQPNKELLKELSDYIYEKTEFKVKVVEKSMNTDWRPIIDEEYPDNIYNTFESKDGIDDESENSFDYGTDMSITGKEKKKMFNTLCDIMMENAKKKKLKKLGENIYIPSNENPTNYIFYKSFTEYIEEVYKNNVIFDSSIANYNNILAFLQKRNKEPFVFIKPNLDWIAFKNGSFNLVEQKFYTNKDLKSKKFEGIISRHYIDIEFKGGDLETPLFDKIVKYQFHDDELIYKFFLAFIGRLLFKLNRFDKLQLIMFLFGES